jgi:hypothetical protein
MSDYKPTMADILALARVQDPGLATCENLQDMVEAIPLFRMG